MKFALVANRQQAFDIERVLADVNVTVKIQINEGATSLLESTGLGGESWDVEISAGGNPKYDQSGDHTFAFATACYLAGRCVPFNA